MVEEEMKLEKEHCVRAWWRDLEGVSMTVRGRESGNELCGRRVGGSTEGTVSGKESDAMAAMRVDLPVAPSPATAIRTSLRPWGVEWRAIVFNCSGERKRRNECDRSYIYVCLCMDN